MEVQQIKYFSDFILIVNEVVSIHIHTKFHNSSPNLLEGTPRTGGHDESIYMYIVFPDVDYGTIKSGKVLI